MRNFDINASYTMIKCIRIDVSAQNIVMRNFGINTMAKTNDASTQIAVMRDFNIKAMAKTINPNSHGF